MSIAVTPSASAGRITAIITGAVADASIIVGLSANRIITVTNGVLSDSAAVPAQNSRVLVPGAGFSGDTPQPATRGNAPFTANLTVGTSSTIWTVATGDLSPYSTGDAVQITTTVAGFGVKYWVYFLRVISGSTFSLHPTWADANNNTNATAGSLDAAGVTVQEVGYHRYPISRRTAPSILIMTSGTLNVGGPAYHISGRGFDIENNLLKVEFSLDGGPWLAITRMTLNTEKTGPGITGVLEYYATMPAGLTPGWHEVRRIDTPRKGPPRVSVVAQIRVAGGSGEFQTIYASANPATTDDSSGVASPVWATAQASPFKTEGGACVGIAAYRNAHFGKDDVDGGVIRTAPGMAKVWDNGGISSGYKDATTAWLTVEAEPGHDRTDTVFTSVGNGGFQKTLLKVSNVGIHDPCVVGNGSPYPAGALLWMNACEMKSYSDSPTVSTAETVTGNCDQVFYTGNEIWNSSRGTAGANEIVVANYIHDNGFGPGFNLKCYYENRVHQLNGLPAYNHADFYQMAAADSATAKSQTNIIVGENIGTNLTYQGFFLADHGGSYTANYADAAIGIAFVRNSLSGDFVNPGQSNPGASQWSVMGDHVLWWSNTFSTGTLGWAILGPNVDMSDGYGGQLVTTTFSVKDNHFWQVLQEYETYVDKSLWDGNHFQLIKGDPEIAGQDALTSILIGTNAVHGA